MLTTLTMITLTTLRTITLTTLTTIFTITQPNDYHYEYTTMTQLETALVNCFCNTELRTATVTKIKGLSIQTQLNTFVLFTLLKMTLDECKTLTKISMHNLSQQFPQTSARFGHDEIRKQTKSILHTFSSFYPVTRVWYLSSIMPVDQ